ncbi:MAG: hypothetical protein UW73_C0012G0005 [Microgenomates group bacterium GW2011_GWB1_44_8]|nr:MAG: hypothetical protein UW73_C0012G0005 [Microgenomates group bacterium GW2011_GWB1_44_8]
MFEGSGFVLMMVSVSSEVFCPGFGYIIEESSFWYNRMVWLMHARFAERRRLSVVKEVTERVWPVVSGKNVLREPLGCFYPTSIWLRSMVLK